MKTNVMEYLDYSAVKYKDKVAFDDLSKNITFGNLEKETKKIASGLLKYQNKPIAIFMDKSVECITTMFGVLQSGNFYTIIFPYSVLTSTYVWVFPMVCRMDSHT